jgi:hypothetical protein
MPTSKSGVTVGGGINVGTALVAVRLEAGTGIHPEEFILKDKP